MIPKSILRSFLCIAGSALLAATLPSQAVPISIPNANFDLRDTLDASYLRPTDGASVYFQYAVESWRQFQAAGNGGPIRMWNPGATATGTNYGYGFSGSAPSGNYVAAVRTRYNDDIAPAQGFTGVRDFEAVVQLLTDTFDPTATYTLTAKVGRLPNLAQGVPPIGRGTATRSNSSREALKVVAVNMMVTSQEEP